MTAAALAPEPTRRVDSGFIMISRSEPASNYRVERAVAGDTSVPLSDKEL